MRYLAITIFFTMLGSYGCSVFMAASGNPGPDLSTLKVGASTGEVESILGKSIKSELAGNKRVDVYEYEMGDESNGMRAFGHLAADLLTLGAWEVIGTPVEAVQGDKYQIRVTYSSDGRVESFSVPVRMKGETDKAALDESKQCAASGEC